MATGLAASAYIRTMLLESGNVDTTIHDDRQKLLHELSAIGNNINQIARSVNAGIAKPEDAKRGLYLLDQVYELMFRIANK